MPDPKEIFKVPKEGEYEGQRVCTIALRPKDRGVSSRVFPSADNQEIHKKLQKRAKLSQCGTQKNVPSENIEENGKKQQKIPRWDVPADASDTLKAFGKFMNDCNKADAEETLSHLTTGEIAEKEVFSDSDSDSSYIISDEEERASTYQNTSVKSLASARLVVSSKAFWLTWCSRLTFKLRASVGADSPLFKMFSSFLKLF